MVCTNITNELKKAIINLHSVAISHLLTKVFFEFSLVTTAGQKQKIVICIQFFKKI